MFRVSIAVAACSLLLMGGVQQDSAPPIRQPEPGEGVICAWAIYTVVLEVTERCGEPVNPATQTALRETVARLDAYVRANAEISDEEFDRFKREQGSVGAPIEQLCHPEALEMARALTPGAEAELRTWADTVLSRPGTPTWGTCL